MPWPKNSQASCGGKQKNSWILAENRMVSGYSGCTPNGAMVYIYGRMENKKVAVGDTRQ